MVYMKHIINLLLRIIEQPDAKKNYRDLKNYLIKENKIIESQAVQHLMDELYESDDADPG